MYSCLLRGATSIDVRGDVLQDYDGIIHDHPNGDRERGEGDDVQRVPRDQQVDEGGNERDGDGEDDDEGCSPSAEEEEDDQHHDDEGDEDGVLERINRIDDEVRGIDEVADLDVRREILLDLREGSTYLASDLYGVGAFLLGDHHDGTALAIDIVLQSSLSDRILDLGDITQVDILPSYTGYYNRA